jgi:large subunit ribosomal protein L7/L12
MKLKRRKKKTRRNKMSEDLKQQEVNEAQAETKAEPKEKTEGKKLTTTKAQEEFVKKIEDMSVMDLASLVKVLEERFNVSAQAPMMMAASGVVAGGAAAGGAGAEEEKTTFSVILTDIGANKIQVIKEIRTVTSLGLKEAKDFVEAAPKAIKEGATKAEAEEIKKKIEASGAKVEIK